MNDEQKSRLLKRNYIARNQSMKLHENYNIKPYEILNHTKLCYSTFVLLQSARTEMPMHVKFANVIILWSRPCSFSMNSSDEISQQCCPFEWVFMPFVFIITLIYYSSCHSSCGCVSWTYLPLNGYWLIDWLISGLHTWTHLARNYLEITLIKIVWISHHLCTIRIHYV